MELYYRFKDRFGTAGVLIGVIALVMAMVTGAYAAGGGLSGKQKKEVKAIAKQFAGKPGAPGEKGAAGEKGANGTNGESVKLATAGSCPEGGTKVTVGGESKEVCNGAKGANGKGVTTGPAPIGSGAGECVEGGATVEVEGTPASKKVICNGEEGEKGEKGDTGEPWTPNNTLPSHATETGTFAVAALPAKYELQESVLVAIPFPIQLAAPLDPAHVRVIPPGSLAATGTGNTEAGGRTIEGVSTATGTFNRGAEISGTGIPAGTTIIEVISPTELRISEEATANGTGVSLTAAMPTGCTGGTVEVPKAQPGFLCAYEGRPSGIFTSNVKRATPLSPGTEHAAGVTGSVLWLVAEEAAHRIDQFGSWAVTAP